LLRALIPKQIQRGGQPIRPLSDGVFDRATGTILYRLARGPPEPGSTNYPDATSTG